MDSSEVGGEWRKWAGVEGGHVTDTWGLLNAEHGFYQAGRLWRVMEGF